MSLSDKKHRNVFTFKIRHIRRPSCQDTDTLKFTTKSHDGVKMKHVLVSSKMAELTEKLLFQKERERLKKKALTIQGYKTKDQSSKKRNSEILRKRIKSKDDNIVRLDSSEKD